MSRRRTGNDSTAVMARRAPAIVERDTEQEALWRKLDFYGTPPFAARAGAELVKRIDPHASTVWEPACGDGTMARCFEHYFLKVTASDIAPQGYGFQYDFLMGDPRGETIEWVVTNPPFGKAVEFLQHGLLVATRGVALLCRLAFLESVDRYAPLYTGATPLSVLAPFSERVPMQLGPWNPKCSSATAYAWFIFRKSEFPSSPTIIPIPPGTRARLSKPDDIRHFCRATDAPLLVDDAKSR